MIWPVLRSARNNFFWKSVPKLDFLKEVSVTMIANSEKIKMKSFHSILLSRHRYFFPIFWKLYPRLCVLLLEHIDVFWMFLLLPVIKNKAIIQNKTENRQLITSSSWSSLTNPWKLFKANKPARQLSFWEFKTLGWFTIIDYTLQNTHQDHILLSLIFYKDS